MRTDYLTRARALVGCRFRAQGRDPELGLDCVGLALNVYEIADAFRRDYRLRGDHQEELKAALSADFRRVPAPQQRPGDLLLWRAAADQLHLGVRGTDTFVHADAKLGRVVETPGPPPWRLTAVFRHRVRGPGKR